MLQEKPTLMKWGLRERTVVSWISHSYYFSNSIKMSEKECEYK